MEYFVTKEQVCHILKAHGHQVVMDSSFVVGQPISEIEAIVDVCDVVAKAAYDQGDKDATEHSMRRTKELEATIEALRKEVNAAYINGYTDGQSYNVVQRIDELTEFNNQLRAENKEFSERLEQLRLSNNHLQGYVEELRQANKDLARAALKTETNESEELEKSIETIQAALSGSFRDNLKLEVTEQHAWLVYGNLKFIVEPMEAWQAVQSCVYLSGLEVDND